MENIKFQKIKLKLIISFVSIINISDQINKITYLKKYFKMLMLWYLENDRNGVHKVMG